MGINTDDKIESIMTMRRTSGLEKGNNGHRRANYSLYNCTYMWPFKLLGRVVFKDKLNTIYIFFFFSLSEISLFG